MKRDNQPLPAGFTPTLAFLDALPVLLFSASCAALALRFQSVLFAAGAVCCVTAGCGKVAWKLLLAFAKTDVRLLSRQLRYLLPAGFLLMLLGAYTAWERIDTAAVWRAVSALPSAGFFLAGAAGMTAMGIYARKLDGRSARDNLVMELTNTGAQAAILAGLLLLH